MKKVLIHISFAPLATSLYGTLNIEECLKEGMDVRYWDIGPLIFKSLENIHTPNESIVTVFKSKKDFEKELKSYSKQAIFNVQINYEHKFYPIFRLLKRYNCTHIRLASGYLPEVTTKRNIIRSMRNPFLFVNKVYNKIMRHLIPKSSLISYPTIVFAAGKIAYDVWNKTGAEVINFNYSDYESARKAEALLALTELDGKKYAVYLDEFIPNHPDLTFWNPARHDEKKYYLDMNNFFTKLENKYNIEIVIAAHPKAYYKGDEFGGRKIFFNTTALLVRDCLFTCTHSSTAVSYAVIYKKPIVFLLTETMLKNKDIQHDYVVAIANELEAPLVNIDSDIDFTIEYSAKAYKNYLYNYLTSPDSENMSSSEILIRTISIL